MEHLNLPGVAPMLTAGLMLIMLTACSPLQSYEALLVLADIGAASAPSRWKTVTPEPARTPVTYTIAGRQRTGDLYLPGKDVPEVGVVLVPGAVPQGKDDARLVALALTLARALRSADSRPVRLPGVAHPPRRRA